MRIGCSGCKKTFMPITSRASLGRSSCTTWSADSSRWSRGFKRMKMNPWFPPPPPRAPAFEKNDSALGSPLTTRFTCSWCSTRERKEMPSRASVMPKTPPMSSLGMNPFGTTMKSGTMATSTRSEKIIVVRR